MGREYERERLREEKGSLLGPTTEGLRWLHWMEIL